MRRFRELFGSIVCVSLFCLLTGGCQRAADPAPEAAPPGGAPPADAPAAEVPSAADDQEATELVLQLLDYAGIERLVASHRGKVVVMDAWSTSCPPCVKEFPKLVALSQKYSRDQLACISLSFDYEGIGKPEEKAQKVSQFLTRQGATFDNVLNSEESDSLYRKFHLASVPAVFVYDQTGALRHRFDNEESKSEADHFTYEDVERLVVELLAEPVHAGAADAKE